MVIGIWEYSIYDEFSPGTEDWMFSDFTTSPNGTDIGFRWARNGNDFRTTAGSDMQSGFDLQWVNYGGTGGNSHRMWLFYHSALNGGMGNDTLTGFDDDVLTQIKAKAQQLGIPPADYAGVDLYATGADLLIGGVGDDLIFGLGGNDVLIGGDGNDTLYGDRGNDTLEDYSGVNTLDGGAGFDRLQLQFTSIHAAWSKNADGSWTVVGTDIYSFTDRLVNIERIDFLDKSVQLRETARSDMDANGTSDVVLQNGGTVVRWSVANGVASAGNVIGSGASGFTVKGSGDFNGDGFADVLLQNGSTVVQWSANKGAYSAGTVVGNAGNFIVKGIGDFNGDRTQDVVLQSGGTVVAWTVTGGVGTAGTVVASGVTGWNVVGTGDFDADGTSDILLQNGSSIVAWNMRNGAYASGKLLGSTGASDYAVVGTGDFNGDGTTDILLKNSAGSVVDWLIKNDSVVAGAAVGQVAPGWNVVATGDYNGDGVADIALQSGSTAVAWIMWNGQVGATTVLGNTGGFSIAA